MFLGVFVTGLFLLILTNNVGFWNAIILFFAAGFINRAYRSVRPRAPEIKVPLDDPEAEEDVHARAQHEEAKHSRETPRGREVPRAPSVRDSNLSAGSLKLLRNVILQHHNMKQTDESYRLSGLYTTTETVLQQLNALIDKQKRAA